MSIWWSLHLRREAASVPLARRLLLGTMETAGVDPDVSFDLSVALGEACANAVEHGGGEDSGELPGAYRVTAYLDGELCRIEVSDSGPGFPARRLTSLAAHAPAPAVAPAPALPPAVMPAVGPAPLSAPVALAPAPPPAALMAESGRGLCLIEQLTDHVYVRNRPGHGAVVSFDKTLKWREDALLRAV
ncbi:ATP-binding protein [Streptomyces sp. NPDC012623]|uniref:ATP-binding protein n=1 Tax=unclassified Streptomyces TaxID=2593676 RepID=UPI00369DAA81